METAKREVFEETGITINNLKLVDAVDYIKQDSHGKLMYHYSLIDYRAVYVEGRLKPGDDATEAKWVSINDLSVYNLWSETSALIKKATVKSTSD